MKPCIAFLASLLIVVPSTAWPDDDSETAAEPAVSEQTVPLPRMGDAERAAAEHIVVLPGTYEPIREVTGSYDRQTDGLVGGIQKGRQLGRIVYDIYGIPVGYQIPILSTLGGIFGGAKGLSEEEVQKFRDRLTRDLANQADLQLNDDALASDVFWRIRNQPALKPKILNRGSEIPAQTDTVLHVGLIGLTIAVEEDRATLATAAVATVSNAKSGQKLYQIDAFYKDTDVLKDWVDNDYAAWRSYAVYARHQLGLEIAANLFERGDAQLRLEPVDTPDFKPDKKDPWRSTTKKRQPRLAWDATPVEGVPQPDGVAFDVAVFDATQMVFAERGLTTNEFSLPVALEPCGDYRWSIRPVYRDGDRVYYGEWLRRNDGRDTENGLTGNNASVATAFLYDFPAFEVHCKAR